MVQLLRNRALTLLMAEAGGDNGAEKVDAAAAYEAANEAGAEAEAAAEAGAHTEAARGRR